MLGSIGDGKTKIPTPSNIPKQTPTPVAPTQTLRPILVPETPIHFNRYRAQSLQGAIGYDYDSYYDENNEYYCWGGEDDGETSRPAPYSVFEGLRLSDEGINIDSVFRAIFDIQYNRETRQWDPIPDDLIEEATQVGELDNPNSYTIETENDYYGQTVKISLNPENIEALETWYYSKNNADDPSGILGYVRSKGIPTTGLTPLEAIKLQLKTENRGRANPFVDDAKNIYPKKVNFKKIDIGNPIHLDSVDPYPTEPNGSARAYNGILAKNGRRYRLIDGYHRYKNATINQETEGTFLILSDTPNDQ